MKIISFVGVTLLAATASASAQVTLNANAWAPQTHPLTTAMVSWCADVEKATSARVKCNLLSKREIPSKCLPSGANECSPRSVGHIPDRLLSFVLEPLFRVVQPRLRFRMPPVATLSSRLKPFMHRNRNPLGDCCRHSLRSNAGQHHFATCAPGGRHHL